MAADKTLIEGAQKLAAAKGGGGVGLQAVLGAGIQGFSKGFSQGVSKNKKDPSTGLTPEQKAQAKLDKALKDNNLLLPAGVPQTPQDRQLASDQVYIYNERLDKATTEGFGQRPGSEEYKASQKQISEILAEYNAFATSMKTLSEWRQSQQNMLAKKEGGSLFEGYADITSNEPYKEKYAIIAGSPWVWNSEKGGIEFKDNNGKFFMFKDRASFEPLLFSEANKAYEDLMKIQESGLNKTGKQRQAQRNKLRNQLNNTFTKDRRGAQILETFLKKDYFPELNEVFENAGIGDDFADTNKTPAERIQRFVNVVDGSVETLVDILIGPVKEDPSGSDKTKNLTSTQKDKLTVAYKSFKNVTTTNPLNIDSNLIPLNRDDYVQWKKDLKKWVIVDKRGAPITDQPFNTFNSLDELLENRGFASTTK